MMLVKGSNTMDTEKMKGAEPLTEAESAAKRSKDKVGNSIGSLSRPEGLWEKRFCLSFTPRL